LIDRSIAKLEPQLFEGGDGLYTAILNEYEKTKGRKGKAEDVADINIRLARFFFWLWVIGIILSISFLILTLNYRILSWLVKFI